MLPSLLPSPYAPLSSNPQTHPNSALASLLPAAAQPTLTISHSLMVSLRSALLRERSGAFPPRDRFSPRSLPIGHALGLPSVSTPSTSFDACRPLPTPPSPANPRKYKISDVAYSVIRSSRTIGQMFLLLLVCPFNVLYKSTRFLYFGILRNIVLSPSCARRWFDEGDMGHLINLGKYLSAMMACISGCHVKWCHNVPVVLGLWEYWI
ncbi:phosphate transporter PHO1-1-like protein [Carex littledalei]|uniref:Phosphate transporter PHO1-1-like protein n=1 Tax=Carex littledalei TaxID=544730 RepID=A0A833QW69_9POAL|nr:phosphate transporter PHO1-1-like protein [Carex littledalei]